MKYMGSKARIAKEILPIMLAKRLPNQYWVEPFVGGGNMIDKVVGKRIGADANPNAISALISIRDYINSLPKNNKEFTEQDYARLRTSNAYPHKGFAGFAYSYAGKWMGGWCRDGKGARDYVYEAYNNAVKQSPKLQGVELFNQPYKSLVLPPNSLIYCDPPYCGTTKYNTDFDHAEFWDWCRQKVAEGHNIFVSEYAAPQDWKCVFEKKIVSSLTKDTGSKVGIEKLFTLEAKP